MFKKKQNLGLLFILLLCFLAFFRIGFKNKNSQERTIMSGYVEGVISSSEILFKNNSKFYFNNLTLLGEEIYEGQFQISNDTILLRYINEKPQIDSEKLVINNDRLIFLNPNNSIKYEFLIDLEYLPKINHFLK